MSKWPPPQKMRRMHGVAQANGQRTVGIEDMLAKVSFDFILPWLFAGWFCHDR